MVERLRTAIVDADAAARSRLLRLLRRQDDIEVVGTARDGPEAVDLVRARRPDLLFLEVQMTALDGFGILSAIPPAATPATIFVSGCERYALQAFEAHALDYLLKPFSDERFASALAHVRRYRANQHAPTGRAETASAQAEAGTDEAGYLERIVLKSADRVTLLDVEDVDWIEAAGVYVHLHVGARTYLHRASVTQLLHRLNPRRFVRVHRSAAVNPDRIHELQPRTRGDYTVILSDGTELMLSRGYRPALEGWLRQRL